METTVVKGLRVLEILAEADQPASLGDISEACRLSKSNVHRLLRTLEACGFVGQETDSRRYFATLKMWELGTRTLDRFDFRAIARPHLVRLAAETEETVHLSVFDRTEALFIDRVDGVHAVRTYVSIGDRQPSYCTASGKAQLAHMPEDTVAAVGSTIRRHTEKTVSGVAELRRQLAAIRTAGYALTTGELRPGVTAVASAIVSESGHVIGAIGVAGPSERMGGDGHGAYIAAVLAARDRIRTEVGLAAAPSTGCRVAERGPADTADPPMPDRRPA